MSKRLTIEEFIETLKHGGSGGGGPMVVTISRTTKRIEAQNVEAEYVDMAVDEMDKTWQEIHDALERGVFVLVVAGSSRAIVTAAEDASDSDRVSGQPPFTVYTGIRDNDFYALSAGDKPARDAERQPFPG